jgi:choline dehydrogenase
MARSEYDYVIVGGGAAGCVLANRLSADPDVSVLVLEAGGPDHWWDLQVRLPIAVGRIIGKPHYDWNYESDPEAGLQSRRLAHPRGKLLGGSSSVNGMIYQRGNRADFDVWGSGPGMGHWDWAHCAPYFDRLENCVGEPEGTGRGRCGPQSLERGPADGHLNDAFFAAAQQAGHKVLPDINDAEQEGFAPADQAVRRGLRDSSSTAYLHPARRRRNLDVRTHAQVSRVVFEGTRAVGVAYRLRRGGERVVRAREVILSGGAIGSPQALQLSGVGDPAHLQSVGVPVVHELPGVGRHLKDHLAVHLMYSSSRPVLTSPLRGKIHWPGIIGRAVLFGRGPGARNPLQAVGFASTGQPAVSPDILFGIIPLIIENADGPVRIAEHGYQVYLGVMHSKATGTVRITSRDARQHPSILMNFMSGPGDRQRWIDAVAVGRDLMNQPAFAALGARETQPGPGVTTDEGVLDWVERTARPGLHLACSARMGTDEGAVVDPATLRVHGLDGIRVIDASIFPELTNGNTYAPVMMLAEKAADIVLGNTPLAPVPAATAVAEQPVESFPEPSP